MATREDKEVEEDKSKNRAVTGRPNDLDIVEYEHPLPNTTLAERAKKRVGQNKRVKAEAVESK